MNETTFISNNTGHGFYFASLSSKMITSMADKIFAAACQIVKEAYKIQHDEDVVALMDSSWGRHTANMIEGAANPDEMKAILTQRLNSFSARASGKRVLMQLKAEREERDDPNIPQNESVERFVGKLLSKRV